MFNYTLYKIKIINKIPMWTWVTNICAENIVDAEFRLQSLMTQGGEYIISRS